MTPEGAVKAKVRKILNLHKVYHFMPSANGYGRVGIPDFICCVDGFFLAIECKAGGNKPTALQKMELEAIMEAGGLSMVINEDNIEDVSKIIEGLIAQEYGVSQRAISLIVRRETYKDVE